MEMTGICKKCGQVRIVDAKDQHMADMLATERCDCEQIAKNKRALIDNLRILCGEDAPNYGFEMLDNATLRFLESLCEQVVEGRFEQVKAVVGDTSIVIKATNSGFSVTRDRKRKATLEV